MNEDMDYHQIITQLRSFNLAETFPEIRRKAEQIGNWSLTEDVERQWTTYQQMLQFMLQGMNDTQSEQIRRSICQQLEIAVGRMERMERMAKSPTDKYTCARKSLNNIPSFESVVSGMEKVSAEMAQTRGDGLLRDSVRQYQMERLEEAHESAMVNLFNWTWTSELWQNTDVALANQLILSDCVSSDDKAVFISAVTLSLLEFSDPAKLLFLLDCYLMGDVLVAQRSLTGFIVVFHLNFNDYKTCEELRNRLQIYRDDPNFVHDIYSTMMQLQMSCTTESVSSKIRNDIMPAFMQGLAMKKEGKGSLDANELMKNGENPEWMADEKVNKKVHEMTEMQLEGADVYYASFVTLKGFSFFSQMPHWFYPFSQENSLVPELKKMLSGKIGNLIKVMLSGSPFCDSDRYSFCFTLANVGQMGESVLEQQVSSQIPEGMDIEDFAKKEQVSKKDRRRHYIFDLYRFFNAYPYKMQFANPFDRIKENPITPFSNEWLKELLLEHQEEMEQYADFLMRKEFYQPALQLFDAIVTNEFDPAMADMWQKKGFCHQKLNNSRAAIHAYTVADSIKPNSKWTLSHLASLCMMMGKMEEAASYYKNLLEISPDNGKYLLHAAQALMNCDRHDEATPLLYKAAYLDESSIPLQLQLAWCLMVEGKTDEAMKYVMKVLSGESDNESANILFSIALMMEGKMQEGYHTLLPMASKHVISELRQKLEILCKHKRTDNMTATLFTDALSLQMNGYAE